MKPVLITASLLAFTAAPALAQEMPADPTAPPPATSEPMPPADAPAMPPAVPPATEPGALPPAEATAPPPATATPGDGLSPTAAQTPADWAKFDTNSKGYLSALDFGNWLMAKNGNDMAADVEKTKASKRADLPAVKVLNATGGEFLKADKDHNGQVTPDELAAYIAG